MLLNFKIVLSCDNRLVSKELLLPVSGKQILLPSASHFSINLYCLMPGMLFWFALHNVHKPAKAQMIPTIYLF